MRKIADEHMNRVKLMRAYAGWFPPAILAQHLTLLCDSFAHEKRHSHSPLLITVNDEEGMHVYRATMCTAETDDTFKLHAKMLHTYQDAVIGDVQRYFVETLFATLKVLRDELDALAFQSILSIRADETFTYHQSQDQEYEDEESISAVEEDEEYDGDDASI